MFAHSPVENRKGFGGPCLLRVIICDVSYVKSIVFEFLYYRNRLKNLLPDTCLLGGGGVGWEFGLYWIIAPLCICVVRLGFRG